MIWIVGPISLVCVYIIIGAVVLTEIERAHPAYKAWIDEGIKMGLAGVIIWLWPGVLFVFWRRAR